MYGEKTQNVPFSSRGETKQEHRLALQVYSWSLSQMKAPEEDPFEALFFCVIGFSHNCSP